LVPVSVPLSEDKTDPENFLGLEYQKPE